MILDLLFWLPSCPQQLRIIFSEGCFRLAEGEIKMSLERIEAGVDDKEDENGEFKIDEEYLSKYKQLMLQGYRNFLSLP